MKKVGAALLLSAWTISSMAQSGGDKQQLANTLLWKISGNGLEKPSYLFGTIHMICETDAALSPTLKEIIEDADEVYFEVDLDNVMESLSMITKMKMRGDTTLKDLLSEDDYLMVKEYFESNQQIFPFSVLEKQKPILSLASLQFNSPGCRQTAMEKEIMDVAMKHKKSIKGLETMSYQAGVLDNIPYKLQAMQLVKHIKDFKNNDQDDAEMKELVNAYISQDLGKIDQIMARSNDGLQDYIDPLLYNRNRDWLDKLKRILPGKSILIAVGAGHLPGQQGMIELLKKAGFILTPVDNRKVVTREI